MNNWTHNPVSEGYTCLRDLAKCEEQLSSVASALKTLGLPNVDFLEGVRDDVYSNRLRLQAVLKIIKKAHPHL